MEMDSFSKIENTVKMLKLSNQINMSFWLTFAILTIIWFVLIYFYTYYWSRTARLMNKFPGDNCVPFIGNAAALLGNPLRMRERLATHLKKHGPCFRAWIFHQPVLFIGDVTVAKSLLSSSDVIEKGILNKPLKEALGNGLVTAKGARSVRDRKLLNASFNRPVINGYYNVFNIKAKNVTVALEELMKTNEEIDAFFALTKCTLEVIFGTVMHTDSDFQLTEDLTFGDALIKGCQGVSNRYYKPWLNWPIIRNIFGNYHEEEKLKFIVRMAMRKILKDRRNDQQYAKSFKDGNENDPIKSSTNFVDILLNSPEYFTEDDSIDHLITLIAGGAESTARSINFTLFQLALNPEIQEKARVEVDSVFHSLGKTSTLTDLSMLKYLEMCFNETLRLHPVFPIITRRIVSDFKLDNGLIIPKNCEVLFLIYAYHQNPDIFESPEKFDPERFNSENKKKSNNSFLPFSKGIRNCIGQRFAMAEGIIILAHILREYEVCTNQKLDDIEFALDVPMSTHPAIKLSFKKRDYIKDNNNL